MNRVTTIFESKSIVIERFDHPEECFHHDPKSELTEDLVVTFIESGGFKVMQDRKWYTFDPSDVLISIPGLRRTYRHPRSCPDDVCLSIKFAPDVIESALGQLPITVTHPKINAGVTSNFAYSWLMAAVRDSNGVNPESAAFHCAIVLGPHRWEEPGRLSGVGAHRRKIQNACMAMAAHPDDAHSLTSLAAETHMSPFHFARVFSELVGEPPHHYLLRMRLQHAADLLRQGARVTEAAVKSGFSDVNHFSKSFRRRYGVPPSRYSS